MRVHKITHNYTRAQFPAIISQIIKLPTTIYNFKHYSSSRILSPLGLTTLPMYRMELVLLSFTRKMKG